MVDSGSGDDTVRIISEFENARIVTRPFDNHAAQWNFGLSICSGRDWVLALDADYKVSSSLSEEIGRLDPPEGIVGFRVSFRYLVLGRPLSGSLYPPVVALFRRDRARYAQIGHTQRLVIDGSIADLRNRIDHDDRKPLSRWFVSQRIYAQLEADHILSRKASNIRFVDRIRLAAWPAPPLVLLYTLFIKGCILDGWPGWLYVLQRTVTEAMIAMEIVDRRMRDKMKMTISD